MELFIIFSQNQLKKFVLVQFGELLSIFGTENSSVTFFCGLKWEPEAITFG